MININCSVTSLPITMTSKFSHHCRDPADMFLSLVKLNDEWIVFMSISTSVKITQLPCRVLNTCPTALNSRRPFSALSKNLVPLEINFESITVPNGRA